MDVHAKCRGEIALLREEIVQLKKEIDRLKAQLNQNSQNSSRPPSSDFPHVASRPKNPPTGRNPGGQPGHEAHMRGLLPVEEVDKVIVLKPKRCKGCGKRLIGEDANPLRHQVTEIPPIRPVTVEYQQHRIKCPRCKEITIEEMPEEGSSQFGARVEATIAYLSGRAHLSKRQIKEVMSDIFRVRISLGAISTTEQRVSEAIKSAVQEAKEYVQNQGVVNADETGFREGANKTWLWAAATKYVSIFEIYSSRGAEAAQSLLGSFAGYLVTDRWNGYNKYPVRKRQLCWAHLIRDFKGFLERGSSASRIGNLLLKEVEKIFTLWRRVRDGPIKRSSFQRSMIPVRRRVEELLMKGTRCGESKTEGMCKMILKVRDALWTFIRVEGIEPTNNAAERAIRPVVIYRKTSFGTHSARGSRFIERIMTVVATLRQQGRNVLEYLTETCVAARSGLSTPSLLPITTKVVIA